MSQGRALRFEKDLCHSQQLSTSLFVVQDVNSQLFLCQCLRSTIADSDPLEARALSNSFYYKLPGTWCFTTDRKVTKTCRTP